MITKIKIKGSMKEIPAPYAPASYQYPQPTIACLESCIKECLPGITYIRLIEDTREDGSLNICARIQTEYKGSAIQTAMNALLEIVQRHIPSSWGNVYFLVDLEHGVSQQLA